MTNATKGRDAVRTPGEIVSVQGASGYHLLAGTGVMIHGGDIRPISQGAGISTANARYIGVANSSSLGFNGINGSSVYPVDVNMEGIVTLFANGTGASADIGKKAYWVDNQTVGTSCAVPRFEAGVVYGLESTSKYRVRITNSVESALEVA